MSYDPPPPPPGGGYGATPGGYAQPKASGKAITALVLGIISIVPCCSIGVIPGAIAVIFGNMANKEIAASNGMQTGRGMAKAGLITGIIGIVLCIVYWVLVASFGRMNFYTSTSS